MHPNVANNKGMRMDYKYNNVHLSPTDQTLVGFDKRFIMGKKLHLRIGHFFYQTDSLVSSE